MIEAAADRLVYVAVAVLLGIGLYMTVASPNLVKKVIGVNLMQTAVFLLFVALAFVDDGSVPIVAEAATPGRHASPLPHVIVLTAIVVGVAVTALALVLIIRLYHGFDTLREDRLLEVRRRD